MATTGISRAPAGVTSADTGLREEAIRFGWYLLGVRPSDDLIERYVRAQDRVLGEPATEADRAVLDFVTRHPWSLPLLDAGTVFLPGAPRLRRKLVVMMAVLEATPDHVDETMPVDDVGVPALLVRLGIAGAKAGVKMAVGTALALVITRRAR